MVGKPKKRFEGKNGNIFKGTCMRGGGLVFKGTPKRGIARPMKKPRLFKCRKSEP